MKPVLFVFLVGSLVAFAVWLVHFGVNQKRMNAHLREVCTVEGVGTVADYVESGRRYVDGDGDVQDSRRAFPVFSYMVGDRSFTHQSERYDSRGERRYEVGQQIAVFHAPDDPEMFYIPTEDAAGNAWTCIGFGVVLLAFSGFAVVRFIYMMRVGL